MTSSELQAQLHASPAPLLLHVLPEEVFIAQRIPGSVNACVYEMAFLDKVAVLAPDKGQPIIVYGAGTNSKDAETALRKLKAAGYTHVTVFEGGLTTWCADRLPIEGDGTLPCAPSLSGMFRVDAEQSVIRWTGRNLFNHHQGTVKLAHGEISLRDNTLISAHFTIAMNSIACEDLTDSTWNDMLIRHLHSDDFFDVAQHPTAEFVAQSVEPLAACTDGTPNYLLRGNFTLRDITQAVKFPILVASADGQRLTAQGVLDLDRTQFGSTYGSGKFFHFLGKHIVNDVIHLHVKLHADKQP
jgi:polyisoprenoid-binding protein YceI